MQSTRIESETQMHADGSETFSDKESDGYARDEIVVLSVRLY